MKYLALTTLAASSLCIFGCATGVADSEVAVPKADAGPLKSDAGGLGSPVAQDSGAPAQDPDPVDAGAPAQGSCGSPFSGAIATFDFTGEPGSQASTPSKSSAPGATVGPVTRAQTVTAVAGLNSINASNWAMTTQPDTSRYFTFKITPPAGCTLDLSSASIDTKTSASGPTKGAVATSVDGFKTGTSFAAGAAGAVPMTVSGAMSAVEVRVYGWGAQSTSGTLRIQNTLTITGALK